MKRRSADNSRSSVASRHLHQPMQTAQQEGLLSGRRTRLIQAIVPKALLQRAKQRAGIRSASQLLLVALVSLALEDDYADWLLTRRGKLSPEVDLSF
jgi:hypothetical protein